MESVITIVAVPIGIAATWFFAWLYYRKAATSTEVGLQNLFEIVIKDKRLMKDKPLAETVKEPKQMPDTFKSAERWDISKDSVEEIQKIVSNATSKIVQKFEHNEIYIPEMNIFNRVLKECAKRVEIPVLKLQATLDYYEDDVEPSLRDMAIRARERLKELGQEIPKPFNEN